MGNVWGRIALAALSIVGVLGPVGAALGAFGRIAIIGLGFLFAAPVIPSLFSGFQTLGDDKFSKFLWVAGGLALGIFLARLAIKGKS